MDSSVIVLDSSDDETSDGKLKNKTQISPKFRIEKPYTYNKKVKKKLNGQTYNSLTYQTISQSYQLNNLNNFPKKSRTLPKLIPMKSSKSECMPIIVSSESLSKANPILNSLLNNKSRKRDILKKKTKDPQKSEISNITITQNGIVLNPEKTINLAKHEPIIYVDDDEESENFELKQTSDSFSITVEVSEVEADITIENYPHQQSEKELQSNKMNTNSLDSDENSEKENSESLATKSNNNNNDIDEPVQKKAKLSDCPIVENIDMIEESDSELVPINSISRQINTNDRIVDELPEDDIHPVFKQFLDLYLICDKFNDKKRNIADKLKMHYKAIDKSYSKSEKFCLFIKKKISEMKESPKQTILIVKEVVDELKVHRLVGNPSTSTSSENGGSSVNRNDPCVQRKIEYLEKIMGNLNKKIKKLDEAEVTSDDEDSAYILVDKYKSRLVKVYKKLCALKGERGLKKQRSINHILSNLADSKQLPDISKLIKKCSSKSEYWFPDFHDITNCVKQAVQNANLNWSDEQIRLKAEFIFTEIGTNIQKERKCFEYMNLCALTHEAPDPADNDPELAETLNKNKILCNKKLDELFNKYTDIQFSSNMVAEEVSDKDIDKDTDSDSEDESDDEVSIIESPNST